MYLPQNDISEVVLRQRNKKQELSKAIVKNRARLTQVRQQIRVLTQPLSTDYEDECERLDDEIDKLRRVCQAMLNEIEASKRESEPTVEQRQPFRPAPPPPPHPPPRARPHTLFPRQPSQPSSLSPQTPTSQHGQSPVSQHGQSPGSPQQQEQQPQQQQPKDIDENFDPDPATGGQPWQCSMCTFQNHPLLNKCECCDNVRVIPGTVRIVPSRPPPPVPLGSRSAPQTPGTPLTTTPRMLTHSQSVANSSSEGNMPQFLGDVII